MTRPAPPEVLVVGGGIGGLCLAQGLRRAGVPVRVFERDTSPGSRWEGYRIHINPAGARSLHACLPDRLWRAFLATSGPGGAFGFLTERLGELLVLDESLLYPGGATDPTADHYAVDRATLRRLLLTGLDDAVRFGSRFERYEQAPGGRVRAVFADGSSATGDVLVGADGSGSRVRRQYLPHARAVDAGVGGLAVKLPLTPDTAGWVPARLRSGMNMVTGGRSVSLFTSAFRPPAGARAALEAVAGPQPDVHPQPYLLCALVTTPDRLPAALADGDPDALRPTLDGLLAGWHPTLRRLLDDADPATRGGVEFRVSVPTPPWPTTRVTVLGDALHTMPATGGLGGNTALRDARLLADRLAAAARGERPLLDALADYERGLRAQGEAAVRETLATRDRMLAAGVARTVASRAFLRLCSAAPPLRRRVFGDWALSTRPFPWEPVAGPVPLSGTPR